MDVNRLARGETERVRPDRLDALLVGPRLDRLFDIGFDAGFQRAEQVVLLVDGQGEQPVEEPGHRRQVLLEVGGGGFGGRERDRRAVRKGRAIVGMDFGLGLAPEMLRFESDPPAGHGIAVRWARPRGHGAAAARQAGKAEAGGILAADQFLAPAVLAEAEQDGRIDDAGAIVGDGHGEAGFADAGSSAGRPVGKDADGDADPGGAGAAGVLQGLDQHVGKRGGIDPRNAFQRAVMDAGADPGGDRGWDGVGRRCGNPGHGMTSIWNDLRGACGDGSAPPGGVPGGAHEGAHEGSGLALSERGAGTRGFPVGPPRCRGRSPVRGAAWRCPPPAP